MSNKYVRRSKISEAKFRELVRLFALDLTATQMAELSGLNRNTVNRYVKEIRKRIAEYCNAVAPISISADGLRDPEIMGIYEREGSVYTSLLKDEKALKDGAVRNKLDLVIILEEDVRRWIKDRKLLQQGNSSKINCIDGFQGFLKSRLEKFKGIHSQTCYLHIKESEFRFNNPKSELYHMILKIIRNKPLFSHAQK